MVIGVVAGKISSAGFNGKLDFLIGGVSDTCGAFWLHGLPGFFGAVSALWVGSKLYYPAHPTPNTLNHNWHTLIKYPWVGGNTYSVYDAAASGVDMNTSDNWTVPGVPTLISVGDIRATDPAAFNPKFVDIWTYSSVFPATVDREYTPDLDNVGESAILAKHQIGRTLMGQQGW